MKQTETNPKQTLFRFVSVRTIIIFVCFEDTLLIRHRFTVYGFHVRQGRIVQEQTEQIPILDSP